MRLELACGKHIMDANTGKTFIKRDNHIEKCKTCLPLAQVDKQSKFFLGTLPKGTRK